MESLLKAAAVAEVAAKMHWRSSYLTHLTRAMENATQPKVRRAAIRTHALEIEAVMKDLQKGRFNTAAGAKIVV